MLETVFAAAGLAGSTVGAAVAVPLLGPFETRAARVRILGGMLLGLALFAGLISARVLGLLPALNATDHAVNLIGLSTAPLAVIYMADETRLRSRAWLWIPALAYLTIMIVRAAVAADTSVPFAVILPVVLGFTGLAIAFRRPRSGSRQEAASLISADAVLGCLILLNAAQVARWLFRESPGTRSLLPLVVTAVVIVVSWKLTRLLPGLSPLGAPSVAPPKYERSGLDALSARAVLDAAREALDTNRRFADPDLTLRALADAAHTTPHRLSEALNLHGGRSFNDLLNRRRVDDAKAQLIDSANDQFTIEGVGQAAGFKSRSAFYTAFRRLEGMTPAEFRRRARHNS